MTMKVVTYNLAACVRMPKDAKILEVVVGGKLLGMDIPVLVVLEPAERTEYVDRIFDAHLTDSTVCEPVGNFIGVFKRFEQHWVVFERESAPRVKGGNIEHHPV